jgi:hypothetical protein
MGQKGEDFRWRQQLKKLDKKTRRKLNAQAVREVEAEKRLPGAPVSKPGVPGSSSPTRPREAWATVPP